MMSARANTPRRGNVRADSRLPQVLDAAATQFAAKGYQAASVRDIVQAVGMLPGSLYCHFANKDELLEAVYAEGVRRISESVEAAAAAHTDPWERLQAACEAHLEALLDPSSYVKVVVCVGPKDVPAVSRSLVALRNDYENMFGRYIAALPLPPGTARRSLRLMLLGALNWAPTWYRPGGGSPPRRVAREFVQLLRLQLAPAAGTPRPKTRPDRRVRRQII